MPLTIATFNVKNLLAARDDRQRAILPAKLDYVAAALRSCDADVVGLQEVGPAELARAVRDRLPGDYGEPVLGTPDARGIRCALLSRVRVIEARVHTAEALSFPVFAAGDPAPFGARIPLRRGVVHALVEAPGVGQVHVLVVHFKSPRPVPERDASGAAVEPRTARERAEGALRGLVWRAAEALHVRGVVDAELSRDASARVAVVGDMNDTPGSIVLRTLCGDGPGTLGALMDCTTSAEPSARFTVLHEGRRVQLDHVLASARLHERVESARFENAALREHGATSADEEPTVDSDHAPVVVRFG